MSAAPSSSMDGSSEMALLLARIAKAETRVDKAEAALEEAEARRDRDEVSACRQILIGSQTTLNLLYEEKKRLTAATAGELIRLSDNVTDFDFNNPAVFHFWN